jgi:hypothetical protein
MPELSPPIESIQAMDTLVALGRGPDDLVRVELALYIAETIAAQQDEQFGDVQKPQVVFCGNEPWHRKEASTEEDGEPVEATGMLGYARQLLIQEPPKYPHVVQEQLHAVGGNSTIESMAQIALLLETLGSPDGNKTFLTDELHDRYGRVGRSALTVFGVEHHLEVVTYPSPHKIKEDIMEPVMSAVTRYALRSVTPGDVDGALKAQQRIENILQPHRRKQ